jgi:hypothetical protein
MRAESKIAQVTGGKRAYKCTLCRYPQYPTDFFSRVNAQDAREEETNRQRNEESNLPFSGRTDVHAMCRRIRDLYNRDMEFFRQSSVYYQKQT